MKTGSAVRQAAAMPGHRAAAPGAAAWLLVCLGPLSVAQAQPHPVRLPPVGPPEVVLTAAVPPRPAPLMPAPGTPQAHSGNSSLDQKLLHRGDLTLRETPMAAALFSISEVWGVNIVVGQEVQGQVNGVFRQAPLCEVLDAILLSNGYGYRPVGQSLVVMKLADLGDLNPMFQAITIPLTYLDPAQIVDGVRLLCSPRGKVQAVAPAKSLMVVDFPDRVQAVRQFVRELDQAAGQTGGVRAPGDRAAIRAVPFRPQYVAANALKASVEAVLSKEGKAAIVEKENSLIVADYEHTLVLAKQVVEQLDVPRQQVRITALIYDLDIEDMERLGINWHLQGKARYGADGKPNTALGFDSMLLAPVTGGGPEAAVTLINLAKDVDLTTVVRAMQEAKDSRLLADPNVVVADHENATMSIVTEIPYQQLTQTQQGGQIGTTAFREAGIKLEVTPHISVDGTVQLQVNPSFSRLMGYTPGENPQPIIDRREAKTVVRVANRQVLVIGGLRQRHDSGEFHGVPYLKDIKFLNLGALFRSRDTSVRESELVVFIMPEIVPTAHVGACREAVALKASQCLLGQVPMATEGSPAGRPEQQCHPMTPIHTTPPQPCPDEPLPYPYGYAAPLPGPSGYEHSPASPEIPGARPGTNVPATPTLAPPYPGPSPVPQGAAPLGQPSALGTNPSRRWSNLPPGMMPLPPSGEQPLSRASGVAPGPRPLIPSPLASNGAIHAPRSGNIGYSEPAGSAPHPPAPTGAAPPQPAAVAKKPPRTFWDQVFGVNKTPLPEDPPAPEPLRRSYKDRFRASGSLSSE